MYPFGILLALIISSYPGGQPNPTQLTHSLFQIVSCFCHALHISLNIHPFQCMLPSRVFTHSVHSPWCKREKCSVSNLIPLGSSIDFVLDSLDYASRTGVTALTSDETFLEFVKVRTEAQVVANVIESVI